MSLTWKDVMATALLLIALLITYALFMELNWPIIIDWRMGSLALLVLGLGSCIFVGSNTVPVKNNRVTVATILGILAVLLGLGGIILNNKWVFVALSVNIAALWALATMYYMVSRKAQL